jgi:hypothetical protein
MFMKGYLQSSPDSTLCILEERFVSPFLAGVMKITMRNISLEVENNQQRFDA